MVSKFDGVWLDAGDVVFMAKRAGQRREKISTAINVNGQRLLAAFRRAERLRITTRLGAWSHVVLALGDGTVIHADGRSVAIDTAHDVLDIDGEELHFRVFRREGLSERQGMAVTREAKRYLAQKYSFRRYFTTGGRSSAGKREDTTQFCSRLVARSFAVAGLPLSPRPEHRVLPIDLYAACQLPPWREVTSDVVRRRWPASSNGILERIEVPGQGELSMISMTEFFKKTDALMDHTAELAKQREYILLRSGRNVIAAQAVIAQHASVLLDLIKQVRIHPYLLGDKVAEKIVQVLEQVGALLDLGLLPHLDIIVPRLSFGESEQDAPPYAGWLLLSELHQSRRTAEMLRLMSYFMLAETGLGVLVAHTIDTPNLAHFKSASQEYNSQFLAALKNAPSVDEYENTAQDLFIWVTGEADRNMIRAIFGNILACLKIIKLLAAEDLKQGDSSSLAS